MKVDHVELLCGGCEQQRGGKARRAAARGQQGRQQRPAARKAAQVVAQAVAQAEPPRQAAQGGGPGGRACKAKAGKASVKSRPAARRLGVRGHV